MVADEIPSMLASSGRDRCLLPHARCWSTTLLRKKSRTGLLHMISGLNELVRVLLGHQTGDRDIW